MRRDMDDAIQGWPYEPEPGEVIAREVRARDGRSVLQIRVELGVLQLEVGGRPDGTRPHGFATYLDYLRYRAAGRGQAPGGEGAALDDVAASTAPRPTASSSSSTTAASPGCALQRYDQAVLDADHTLALMDFVRRARQRRGLHRLARAVPRAWSCSTAPRPPRPWRLERRQARRGDRRRPRGDRAARRAISDAWSDDHDAGRVAQSSP